MFGLSVRNQRTGSPTWRTKNYQPDETIRLEVRVENETSRDVKTIGKHIKNALNEELEEEAVGAKFATTAADGKTYHDRFLIIDDVVYLFGANLKDAGKKLFAYIKMQETSANELLSRIR